MRRRSCHSSQETGKVLDSREFDISKRIAQRIAQVLSSRPTEGGDASLSAIRDAFDEQVIASHLAEHHGFEQDMTIVLDAIHELAEQTYENKPLTFGGVLDPGWTGGPSEEGVFPRGLFSSKKYKALSDGFRTAYHLTTDGHLLGFVDLEKFSDDEPNGHATCHRRRRPRSCAASRHVRGPGKPKRRLSAQSRVMAGRKQPSATAAITSLPT